jgi:hypothetical protein
VNIKNIIICIIIIIHVHPKLGVDTSSPIHKLGVDAPALNSKVGVDPGRIHAQLGAPSHAHTQVRSGRVHA